MNIREKAIVLTKKTGILPAIKIKFEDNLLPYIRAMYDAGIRVVEITTTTPNAFEHYKAIHNEFNGEVLPAAGTVLDATTARLAILSNVKILVSPSLKPEVIATAKRYGVACFSGAFTATEVQSAMELGADMIKIFPAALGGPKYMTNLKMVFPQVNLIPSGGISLDTAGEFIKCGASAISGARNFFDYEMVKKNGTAWITEQIKMYMEIVENARNNSPELP